MKKGHVCPNRFAGDGAKGACYFEIQPAETTGRAHLNVGWACAVVHDREIPVSWLSELVAIATAHEGGIAGFLKARCYGDSAGASYALTCDPAEAK